MVSAPPDFFRYFQMYGMIRILQYEMRCPCRRSDHHVKACLLEMSIECEDAIRPRISTNDEARAVHETLASFPGRQVGLHCASMLHRIHPGERHVWHNVGMEVPDCVHA